MFFARKISRAKWDAKRNADRGLAEEEISADAVTGDLRTQDNVLSFWRCGAGTSREIDDVALAIAAGCERLDKLDIVWLAVKELQSDGQTMHDTKGQTPVKDLADRHVDICGLDYVRLGRVAQQVVVAIEDERCCRLSRARVKGLLVTAVDQGRIGLHELTVKLQEEINNQSSFRRR